MMRTAGGVACELAATGATHVSVVEVQLTVLDETPLEAHMDSDEFLRSLVLDPEQMSAWFAGAATADPAAFEEGLMELLRVSGPSGFMRLLESLAAAFIAQSPEAKDVLLGLSLDDGPTRDLTAGVFSLLSPGDIATSVLEGDFGRNMLSLSTALTRLPLERVTEEVRAEVQALLPSAGHSEDEAQFLSHMIEMREAAEPEPTLTEADGIYRAVVEAATVADETVDDARESVLDSQRSANATTVRTMLSLLDQDEDFDLYCQSMDSLAEMVPGLIEDKEIDLACTVLLELTRREAVEIGPWPDLSSRVAEALEAASGTRSMGSLVRAVVDDPLLTPAARAFLRLAGPGAPALLVSAAIELKDAGLDVAAQMLDRRFGEILAAQAPSAPWHQLAPVAARLAADGGPAALNALGTLMRRPDAQSRREVVLGVAQTGGPAAMRVLAKALSDPSTDVVLAAARALGKSGSEDAANILASRLEQTDIDNDDFDVVVELIGALAQVPGSVADETLAKLSMRRGFLKRARYGEIQDLLNRAQAYRAQVEGVR